MSDLFTEIIVKKKKTAADTLKKAGLIALTVIAVALFILGFLGIVSMVILVAVGVLDFFIWPTLDVEYEYLYVNGELDIDKIMSKQKRKRVFQCDLSKIELLAPSNSHEFDYHRNNKSMKVFDFSSQQPDAKTYTMIIPSDKGTQMVIFEPDETILNDVRRMKPREVKLY